MLDVPVILLVEDSEDDVYLIRRAIKNALITNPVKLVRDGEEAVAYLKGEGKFANRTKYPFPSLVLLDLGLPKMDGLSVLRWIREQREFNLMRVVVLTNSLHMNDTKAAYAAGANSFLIKPTDFQESVRLMIAMAGQYLPPAFETPDDTGASVENGAGN
jgi:CheY-like chemotaxis protein